MNRQPIVLQGVSKAFGRTQAVRNIDLAVDAGECVGLVGHNGAGKSTLIKLMLGLVRQDAGSVVVLGECPSAGVGARARREIGYLPENVSLYPSMTGAEALGFYAKLKSRPSAECQALLDRVGLAPFATRRVGTYSKGMRQRLGLAQALLGNPRILLLDEPTTGLDPEVRQTFYRILRDTRKDGTAILLSSHALAELEGEVDRIAVMHQGRKVAEGDVHHLRMRAGIEPRLRVRLHACRRMDGWTELPGGFFERDCADGDIRARINELPDTAQEIEIVRPSLDEVYAAFLRREEAGA